MRIRDRRVRTVLAAAAVVLPGRLRRAVHTGLLGHAVHPTARIGHSFVDVDRMELGPRASIGHLNVIRGLEDLSLAEASLIGHMNFVNAVRRDKGFFTAVDRRMALTLHYNARILGMHVLDCCAEIELGPRVSIAGFQSLLQTHSFDHRTNRQDAIPVRVWDNTLISSRCTLLPGAVVPENCIVAAGATVTGVLPDAATLYGGTPARALRELDPTVAWFTSGDEVIR